MSCNDHLQRHMEPPPTQNFSVNTDDATHTLKGYKTVYCLYNWGLWGRSEQVSQADPKMFWGSKEKV